MTPALGIDIGGTYVKLAVVSEEGTILSERKVPTPLNRDARGFLQDLRPYVAELTREAGLSETPACGIGVPGVVNYASGMLDFSGPLGWRSVPFADLAEEILGCTVTLDTDVNAGALADLWCGAARDSSDALYVSWGTGIGAAMAIGRKIYHSRGGAMCNLGHMPAKPDSSRLCYCGTYGCLEVEAGGKAMVEKARQRCNGSAPLNGELTPAILAEAAARGDAAAREILEEAAVLLARVLGGVLALLNPDTVVLGGGVSSALPIVRDAFDNELRLRTPAFSLPLTEIKYSRFGDSAGVVGAAILGRLGKR